MPQMYSGLWFAVIMSPTWWFQRHVLDARLWLCYRTTCRTQAGNTPVQPRPPSFRCRQKVCRCWTCYSKRSAPVYCSLSNRQTPRMMSLSGTASVIRPAYSEDLTSMLTQSWLWRVVVVSAIVSKRSVSIANLSSKESNFIGVLCCSNF